MTESRALLPTAYKERTNLSSIPTFRIIPFSQQPQNKQKLLDLLRETLYCRYHSSGLQVWLRIILLSGEESHLLLAN